MTITNQWIGARRLAAAMTIAVPALAAAQSPQVATPESAGPPMARAAGMALQDGALAPGLLTVRIVEGAFTNNLSGQLVRLEVAGGAAQTATTGTDGRAQFAHLPVGGRVKVSATVNGAPLVSEEFEMPAASGVRVLLVAGEGPVIAEGSPAALPADHPVIPPQAEPAASTGTGGALPEEESGVVAVRVILLCSTIVAALSMAVRRRRAG